MIQFDCSKLIMVVYPPSPQSTSTAPSLSKKNEREGCIKITSTKKDLCKLGAVFLSRHMVRSQNFEYLNHRFACSVVAKTSVCLDNFWKLSERILVFFIAS